MQIWNYEASTGALVGPGMADPCPIEAGNFLIPANATTAPPPEFDPETETCIFADGSWSLLPLPEQASSPKPDLAALANEAVLIVQAICAGILQQIYPDPVRQAAMQTAAAIVGCNAGQAPSSGPLADKFEVIAKLYIKGNGAKDTFCRILVALQGATIDLNIALVTAENSIASAKKPAQLKAALDGFQSSIAAIVSAINDTSLPAAVVAPGQISIPGINA
ncbi:hypothetical protein AB4037_23475 [Labrys sp. KB_33_2]|uniref:hypothetical protein n=1 Tax=unclassified Labrys (in: a-proteobacteria) TaxID=2688601 RepID=UPI003EBE6184